MVFPSPGGRRGPGHPQGVGGPFPQNLWGDFRCLSRGPLAGRPDPGRPKSQSMPGPIPPPEGPPSPGGNLGRPKVTTEVRAAGKRALPPPHPPPKRGLKGPVFFPKPRSGSRFLKGLSDDPGKGPRPLPLSRDEAPAPKAGGPAFRACFPVSARRGAISGQRSRRAAPRPGGSLRCFPRPALPRRHGRGPRFFPADALHLSGDWGTGGVKDFWGAQNPAPPPGFKGRGGFWGQSSWGGAIGRPPLPLPPHEATAPASPFKFPGRDLPGLFPPLHHGAQPRPPPFPNARAPRPQLPAPGGVFPLGAQPI